MEVVAMSSEILMVIVMLSVMLAENPVCQL